MSSAEKRVAPQVPPEWKTFPRRVSFTISYGVLQFKGLGNAWIVLEYRDGVLQGIEYVITKTGEHPDNPTIWFACSEEIWAKVLSEDNQFLMESFMTGKFEVGGNLSFFICYLHFIVSGLKGVSAYISSSNQFMSDLSKNDSV